MLRRSAQTHYTFPPVAIRLRAFSILSLFLHKNFIMPKIVFLDSFVLNPGDLDWGVLAEQGQLTVYERTPSAEIVARAAEAEVIILNKVRITAEILDRLPRLRLILVAATGYDVVDVAAARERGVTVCNVPACATASVP